MGERVYSKLHKSLKKTTVQRKRGMETLEDKKVGKIMNHIINIKNIQQHLFMR